MRTKNPDVVVVGAGIAGASVAAVLARGGLEVLLLERQRAYRDRVRGEYMAPWGVLEARAAGLETVIRGARAVDARYNVPYDELVAPSAAEAARGDASTILPGVRGPLCASHPQACQALADEAVRLGTKLVCGVTEVRVQAGTRPSVTYLNGTEMQVRPRLIIGADGRTSTVRQQSGIHINKAPASHVIAGLLVERASRWPADQFSIGVEGDLQFYVFPQGGGRLRLYTCHANEQATRWAGRAGPQRFLQAFAGLRSIPAARGLGGATAAGPCATFSGEQTWCEEPYADGGRSARRRRGIRRSSRRPGPIARNARRTAAFRTAARHRRLDGGRTTTVRPTARRAAPPHAPRVPDVRGVDDDLHRRWPRPAQSLLHSLGSSQRRRPAGTWRHPSRPGPPPNRGVLRPAPRIAADLTSTANELRLT